RDGWRILLMITRLFVNERPLSFFSTIAALLALAALALAVPLVLTWLHTGLVPRLPTAVLATGMMLAGMLSAACGAVLRTVTLGRRQVKRLCYLSIPGVRYVLEREWGHRRFSRTSFRSNLPARGRTWRPGNAGSAGALAWPAPRPSVLFRCMQCR